MRAMRGVFMTYSPRTNAGGLGWESSVRQRMSVLGIGLLLSWGGVLQACGEDEPLEANRSEQDNRQSGGTGGSAGTAAGRFPTLTIPSGANADAALDGTGGFSDASNSDVGSEDVTQETASGEDASDAQLDAPPDGPPVCGDGWRDTVTEECDDGPG